jgi:DNA-binding transcriptional MerR regulator
VRDLDITAVAQRSGVPASALRFYEEKGLIASVGRRGLRRVFDPRVLERLALIALGRAAGFSLDEIAHMFAPDGKPRIDRETLTAKAEELERTIRKLSALRDGLRHAAACPAPHGMPDLPPTRRGRLIWSYWATKKEGSAGTIELEYRSSHNTLTHR